MIYNFDVEATTKRCIKWIRDWFNENGRYHNAVIGISGGKDSTVVAALCVEALGENRVYGVLMPDGYDNNEDIITARSVVSFLGIHSVEIDIHDTIRAVDQSIKNIYLSKQAMINLPPRIRMATLYAVSQSVNGRVANTCNLSEDWIGYSTRYGDSVGDFSPLSRLTVDEVKQIGIYLGLPAEFVNKTPSDGLCGKTDEDNFGFTYAVLDKYIRTGEIEDIDVKYKIDTMHATNQFKLLPMPCFEEPVIDKPPENMVSYELCIDASNIMDSMKKNVEEIIDDAMDYQVYDHEITDCRMQDNYIFIHGKYRPDPESDDADDIDINDLQYRTNHALRTSYKYPDSDLRIYLGSEKI